MKRFYAVVAVLLLAGCAMAPSERAATVKDADAKLVANCQYLGDIGGASLWGGVGGHSAGVNNSKNQARDRAAALGATHVVWDAPSEGMATFASGKAYHCGT